MMPRYMSRIHAWISGANASPNTLAKSPVAKMPRGSLRNRNAFMNVKTSRATPKERTIMPVSRGLFAKVIGILMFPEMRMWRNDIKSSVAINNIPCMLLPRIEAR
jgi:hypothetical protein